MSRRIEENGKCYRIRRGVKVEIPTVWIGQVTHQQTIAKRPSKYIHKQRKAIKYGASNKHAPRCKRKLTIEGLK